MLRIAAAACLVAPPTTAAAVLVAIWSSPGYDPLQRSLSALGERGAPLALLVNLSFCVLGGSVLTLALALERTIGAGGRGGVILLGLAGACLVGVGLVARDPTHPQPLALHRLLAVAAFVCLGLAPLLLAPGLRRDLGWRGHARASLGFGAAAIALLAAGLVLLALRQLRAGVWEVVFAGLSLVWLTLTAVRLTLATRRPTPP
ncbi:MAG TPA: DUF998 domain-containing protein [Candidatus Dormibacteraeota bacterium]